MSYLTIKQCSEQCFVAHKEIKGYISQKGFSTYPQGLCKIPNEIFFKIFYFLNYQDLTALPLVCKKWKVLLQDETFWESHCKANFILRNSLWMDYGITWKVISSILHGAIFQQPLHTSSVALSELDNAARKRLEWHRNDPYRVRNGSVATFEEKSLQIRINPTQKIIKKIDIRDPMLRDSFIWDFQGNILVTIGHPVYYGQPSFNFSLKYLIIWDLSINKEIVRKELNLPKYATLKSLAIEGEEIFIEYYEYVQNNPIYTILKVAPKLFQEEKKT